MGNREEAWLLEAQEWEKRALRAEAESKKFREGLERVADECKDYRMSRGMIRNNVLKLLSPQESEVLA